ncbi:MAG: fibro-slime domain-containing protein, partial [Oscillospiraceae bacterium]|nr:fibro-slime domain-containing protein [Oscillospiraceae bacterium]
YPVPGSADYFFGMEMEASFTQTESGLDNWGHDIIFEFSGDDDFWLYVDGTLVIDLGGVHSARSGSVNFRTGDVVANGVHTDLYTLFGEAYRQKNPNASDRDVADYLDSTFKVVSIEGRDCHVFENFTNHTMKMFYMERGAGSSNLHMRFNLASVKPGTVMLSKKISGTEKANLNLMELPYQIWFRQEHDMMDENNDPVYDDDGNVMKVVTEHLLDPGLAAVHYADSNRNVRYESTFTNAAGKTYSSVYLLKPGETAEIEFPPDTTEYKIIECGVDTAVYGHVYVDGTEIFGHPYGNTQFPVSGNENDSETLCYSGSSRSDFGIPYTAVDSRPKVEYNNEVNENALRTLSVTKILHDIDGTVLSRDNSVPANRDDTVFSLRLHLGGEDSTDLLPAYMADYCVRDEGGNYCRWNSDSGRFESLGVSDYNALTDAQKASATFTTSMNGSISKIPAGYTVELRDVLVGTRFMVEERTWEIPDGYSWTSISLK